VGLEQNSAVVGLNPIQRCPVQFSDIRIICWYFAKYQHFSQQTPLNDRQINSLRPSEKAAKHSDGGGLHLFVSPSCEIL
jgi:hypothetical protein